MRAISENRFDSHFKPIDAPDGSTLFDHKDTLQYPLNRVWTVIEPGDGKDNKLYASPGYHIVNVIGYCVTEVPWTDDTRDAVYSS